MRAQDDDPESAEAEHLDRMKDEERERTRSVVAMMDAVHEAERDRVMGEAMGHVHGEVHHDEQGERIDEPAPRSRIRIDAHDVDLEEKPSAEHDDRIEEDA